MNERWIWTVRYIVVIALALILAFALGEMDLFKTSRLGRSGLSAARIVQFLGFGGALLVFWLLAQRAAALLPAHDGRWSVLKPLLLPLATLVVVACAHSVVLRILGPLMGKGWHQGYNWVFIAAIVLAAAWLVVALFTGSASLASLFEGAKRGSRGAGRAESRS